MPVREGTRALAALWLTGEGKSADSLRIRRYMAAGPMKKKPEEKQDQEIEITPEMIEAGASVLRRFVHESPSGVDAENFGYGCINRNIYASSAACSCRSIRSHRASIDHFASKKHQHLYNSRTWKRLRRLRLATDPLCAYCRKQGVTRAATVVDHIKPHRGDWALFADPSNTQSLCKHCHDSIKQSEERLGYSRQIGPDGWPIDPNHPVYNRR